MMLKYQYQITLQFLEEHFKGEKKLIITTYPHMYIIQNYDAVDFNYANSNPRQIIEDKYHDNILVFQRYRSNPSYPVKGNELDTPFRLNALDELKLSRDIVMKISEVILETKK